jgi:hypothetical protein
MNKKKIKEKVKHEIGFKAPEQLRQMLGETCICLNGVVSLNEKYKDFKPKNYLVGLVKQEKSNDPRIAILFNDNSIETI